MKKTFLLLSLIVSTSVIASAGVKPVPARPVADDNPAPLSAGRFIDNWFVSASAGVNTILDNGFLGLTGLAADVTVGKWFIPGAGFRLGWHGLTNQAKDTSNGWFAGEDKFSYNFAHVDLMWDVMNSFRYNEKRLVSIVPMLQAGVIVTSHGGHTYSEFGFGGALQLGFNVTRRLRANLEVSATFAREEAWRKAGTIICFPSATAGIQVAVGRTGFRRNVKEVVRTETIRVMEQCNHEQQIASLKARLDSLQNVPVAEPEIEGWTTYFQLDRSVVTERERYHLMDLVSILPEGAVLTIVGHADKETGSKRRNAVLAEERVKAVAAALRQLGFPGEVRMDHKGDTANPFGEPYMKNRCVTIKVTLTR